MLSYNSTGFNPAKAEFLRFLIALVKADFVFVQEHFMLRSNAFKIQNEFKELNSFILPATKSDNFIHGGRPSGGLAILWRSSLNAFVKRIDLPDSSRVQAITLNKSTLIINCYFPCDSQDNNFDDWELIKCLEEISGVINSHPGYQVVIAGDLNCDFSRNTPFVNIVHDFIMTNNLSAAWWLHPVDFTFSFTRNDRSTFSTIDHFILCDTLQSRIKDASVIHLGDNLSGHEPIFLSVDVTTPARTLSEMPNSNCNTAQSDSYKPCWNKATSDQRVNFKESLLQKLKSISLQQGIICNDVNCKVEEHQRHIDSYCDSLLSAIDDATSSNIPPISRPNEKILPGWLELVKPFQEEARFIHAIWISYGKPQNCPLHDSMKRSRNAYHYAIRKLKRDEEQTKNKHLLDHCLKGNSSNVIKEFKKQNPRSEQKSSVIDGHSSNQNIANTFCGIYTELYQRNDSSDSLNTQIKDLQSSINAENFSEVEMITTGVVYQAIKTLKNSKNDNTYCFKSDALTTGIEELTDYLTLLYQAFIIHGYIPHFILNSTLKPIIKDKLGDKCASSNYRAIGSSSLLLKLFDIIVLILFENSFKLSENQFGFQKSSSTTLCSWTVKETVNYFLNRDTPVYACFLDMTKAFDLVNYSKLFVKLKTRVSPLFLRLLAYIYLTQKCDVKWNLSRSPVFNVLNGVRQGAILSPTLFSIYIDDLFDILKKSGFGCMIKGYYYGAVSYADDIVLLCPSLHGLQQMINITKEFFDNLDLVISLNILNPDKSKTKCIAFGVKTDPPPMFLDNAFIPWTDRYTHLGHILFRNGTSGEDCIFKRRMFIGKYHSLCQVLKHKDPLVYMKLISIYMCDFYGSNLWNLSSSYTDKLYTMWNQMIRFVFKLPFRSHRYLIEPISETTHLKTKLANRFLKFCSSLDLCNKPIVRNLKYVQVNDCRSDFGVNCRILSDLNNVAQYHPIAVCDEWRVPFIKEILSVFNHDLAVDLDNTDLKYILDFVACS